MSNNPEWLTTEQAAAYIGKSKNTLVKWRSTAQPGAPKFIKVVGSVYYLKQYLDDYLAERTYASTSEYKRKPRRR